MVYLYIFLAILVLVSTNPIPNDLNEPTMFNSDSHDDNLTDSGFPSNEVTIADSNVFADPNVFADSGCPRNAITDGNLDDNIQKRFQNVCPITPSPPKPIAKVQRAQPDSIKSTETFDNPCNNEYSKWLSCGGPLVTDGRAPLIYKSVLNCVHAVAIFITASRAFPPTETIAQFCCKKFEDLDPLYAAYECEKKTPETLISIENDWLMKKMGKLFETRNDPAALMKFLKEIWNLFKF